MRYDNAYIGLSYVQSVKNNEKISIGCSQLFDSEGNGMKLYLRPLKNPQIIQKNPFMRSEDACRLMGNLKKYMMSLYHFINYQGLSFIKRHTLRKMRWMVYQKD